MLVAATALFGAVPSAWAGAGVQIVPNLPSPLIVRQASVPASLTLTNTSSGAEAGLTMTVNAVTLVASCGTQAISGGDCPGAAVDPGVLRLSAIGVGEAMTACAGIGFTPTPIDPAQGKYQFVPESPVGLGPTGSPAATCVIDFTVDVMKKPTKDANPDTPGLQTDQVAFASAAASDGQPAGGFGTNLVTIAGESLGPMTTAVTPGSITLGSTFHDTATLSPPGGAAAPTGTVTFVVYGPADPTCVGPAVFTSTNALDAAGATASSSEFTPTATGTYRVIATYGGDPHYAGSATACNDAGEAVAVNTDERPTAAYTPSTYTPIVGQTVSFDGRASSDPDGTIATYRWVWGDGTPDGSGPTPTHAFATAATWSVGLYITDSDGQRAAVGHGITVGSDETPTAAYTASTYSPTVNQTVAFDATASVDPDGSIVTYQWVWGDGSPDGTGPTPTHAFATAGARSVVLRVTDGDGQTAVVAHGLTAGTGAAPAAVYTASTLHPAVGQTVSFDGSASSDPDGTITAYRWVWGDGTPDGSGPTATHAFARSGSFSVALIVTDNDGQTGAVGHGVSVGGPLAAYTPSTYAPKVGATVSFDGQASSDSTGTITAYRWVWGDGTPDGSGATATHAFAAAGTRSVALYVTDSNGRTAAVGHGLTVTP